MKFKIAVLFLIVLLCLTTGCSNTSHITDKSDPVSFSESKEAPGKAETAQAEGKLEVEQPHSTVPKAIESVAEATVSVSESDTQTKPVPEQRERSTPLPTQPSEPTEKTDESERKPETSVPTSPPEKEQQPTPPATEKPAEQPQPTEPPAEPPIDPDFDIGYWISFAKSYAESVGLTLNSEAIYCWDNPIAAGTHCKYTERDIKGYLNRYAKASEITDVWVWYEQTGNDSFEVYIGYA